jgi:hypothetical protein
MKEQIGKMLNSTDQQHITSNSILQATAYKEAV